MRWLLVLTAEAVYLGFLSVPDAKSRLVPYLMLMGAAGLLALLAGPILSASRPGPVLLAAALFRATLLFRAPDLSDDIARYVWDARVAAAGLSPWKYAPDDPAVARVAPELRARVAHREIRTLYPPVAEAAFGIGSLGGKDAFALKAFFAAADLAIVWLLARQGCRFAAALYAFHPLAVTEIAGQGHLDSFGIALLLAALAFLDSERRALAGISYAASVLTKYVSAACLLPILRKGKLRLALSGGATVAALWFAAARGGAPPIGGLPDYATRWEFNSVLYPAAVHVLRAGDIPARAKRAFLDWKERHGHPPWTRALFPYFYEGFFARVSLAALLLLLLIAIAWRVAEVRAATFASLAVLLLLSPTLHPWYLLWTLPFAAEKREPAFLFLSLSAPLAYGLLYPAGLSRTLILAAEYGPFALLLAVTLARTRLGSGRIARP